MAATALLELFSAACTSFQAGESLQSGAGFFSVRFDVLQNPQGFVLGEWWKSQPRAMSLSCEDECGGCSRAARVMIWNTHTVVPQSQSKNLEGLF